MATEAAESPVVLSERSGSVLTLTLNRPSVFNALNDALKQQLLQALTAAARDAAVRCVVLTGAGRAFCSGQDLKELEPGSVSVRESLRRGYHPLIRLLRTMEKPVLAALNGVAAGAGCSLALACDMRIVSASAGFSLAFSNIGLAPDAGATFLLPRLAGLGVAMEMAFTGRVVGAEEAVRLGLANRMVGDAELGAAVLETAQSLAARPTRALGLAKRALNRALDLDLDAALDYEAAIQEIAARTDDFREGLSAFRAKRTPRFEGR